MRRGERELREAVSADPSATSTWEQLADNDRQALTAFVADAWTGRGRRRRAALVASKCAEGRSVVWQWQADGYAAAQAGFNMQ